MRPKKVKCIDFTANVTFFKPAGIPLQKLEHVHISREEVESLRLANIEELSQAQIAQKMNVHQSTVQRMLKSARKKLTIAIIQGKAICLREGECNE